MNLSSQQLVSKLVGALSPINHRGLQAHSTNMHLLVCMFNVNIYYHVIVKVNNTEYMNLTNHVMVKVNNTEYMDLTNNVVK